MDRFLNWLFAFLTNLINGFKRIISGIFSGIGQIFNLNTYVSQLHAFGADFRALDWILAVVVILSVLTLFALIGYLLFLGIRRHIRFRRDVLKRENILTEMDALQTRITVLTEEKEKLFSLSPQRSDSGSVGRAATRFARLSEVDAKYRDYVPPVYREDLSLSELCAEFRLFACSRLHLFYDIRTVRLFFSALAASKLILLQGISGTGKTSLPYAMGKFFGRDSTVVSVQPSWRDRTELFGYFNEFSRKFNETELLRRIYEASYNDDMNLIVLDEMNIARVEYYFAEMLSVMEIPDPNEWRIELVPSVWENDPARLDDGKLFVPQNIWYVGTANNDDSTFAVSDKVYDRALPINLDEKGVPFEAPDTPPAPIGYSFFRRLCEDAVKGNPIPSELISKLEQLDGHIMKTFRVAFGNRIVKQMKIFVPVYVACGGDVLDGIDHILSTKILRKLESLNLSFLREDLEKLIRYLEALFGEGRMSQSAAYLTRLQKLE